MNDQLFQQLLDSVTQMTEIIKKQQETIDKLTTKDVQYIQIEKISTEVSPSVAQKHIDDTKTTGVNEQKDVAMSGAITEGSKKGNVKDATTSQRPVIPPPPCRVIKDPSFWGIFSKGE